jgi:hypothetical protein
MIIKYYDSRYSFYDNLLNICYICLSIIKINKLKIALKINYNFLILTGEIILIGK